MADPVTPDLAVEVLKVASAYDGRKPSVLQAQVWAADLTEHGVTVAEAAKAVRRFYTERPDDYVKPGHVIALTREAVSERREREHTRELLADDPTRPALGSPEAEAVKQRLRVVVENALADRNRRRALEALAVRGECPGVPHRGHAYANEPCPLNDDDE
jgi:hypothetical protein